MKPINMTSRFKIRLTGFFYAIAIGGVIVSLIMLLNILGKIDQTNTQIKRQSDQIKSQGEKTYRDLQAATKTLEQDMACMGTFFSQKDRANLRIIDLRKCVIVNEETGEQRELPIVFVGLPSVYTPPADSTPSSTAQSAPPQQAPEPSKPPEQEPLQVAPQPTNILNGIVDILPPVIKNVLSVL